jgi:hypothetical protein
VALTALNGLYTVTNQERIFAADESVSYDVAVDAADKYLTTTRTTSASTAFSLFDWHPDGTGARFGGVSELSHTLQNDLELRQVGNRYVFNTPGVAGTEGFIHMASIEIFSFSLFDLTAPHMLMASQKSGNIADNTCLPSC